MMKFKRKNREGEEEKGKKIKYGWFILWTCNQTVIIILKNFDIKKLNARIKIYKA